MKRFSRNTLSLALGLFTAGTVTSTALAADAPEHKTDPKNGTHKSSDEYRGNRGDKTKASAHSTAAGAASAPSSQTMTAEQRSEAMRNERASMKYPADNTGKNARDVNELRPTADDQSMSGDHVELLARIRKDITNNDALSTNAKNVKIMIENSVITLRGPVQSVEEKNWIEQTARRDSTGYTVVNQLEIAK